MAIEAKDFTEKDELIAKFYTIRAGLSVIAEETEKFRKLEEKISDLKYQDKQYKEKIVRDTQIERYDLQRRIHELEENEKEAQKSLSYLMNSRRAISNTDSKINVQKVSYSITGGIGFFGLIIVLICMSSVMWLIYLVSLIMSIVIIFNINKKRVKIAVNEEVDRIDSSIHKVKSMLETNRQKLEEKRKVLHRMEEEQLSLMKKSTPNSKEISLLESNYSTTVAVSTAKAKSIRNALIEEFGNILTEDDWGNVDLLIFYLNTGRADSLKEALQLVDRQRQTNQIVQAIGTAASYISNTMQANTYKLARVMDNCFSNLSNQISTNHQQLIGAMNNISDSFNSRIGSFESTVKTQSQALLDSQALNASLLKEANRRSDELMNELRYNQKYWVK